MLESLQFSTNASLLAKGGLLVCGKNWGGESDNPEIEQLSEPWAPYFSHPANSSRYQTYLLKWFRLWDWPLDPETPTLLDLAILQTNLFFTQSSRFRNGFDDTQWTYAIQRLCAGIMRFNISGLMITSKEVGDRLIAASQNPSIPEWNRAIGQVQRWSPGTADTLCLTINKTNVLNIAIMNHPASGVSDADVKTNGKTMNAWIADVVRDHRRKQFAEECP